MIILGSGAIMAAIANWDWWFRINTVRAQVVHDVLGRLFSRILNFIVGAGLVFTGVMDVSGLWPVSELLNAYVFNDPAYIEDVFPSTTSEEVHTSPTHENPSALPEFVP